jgi:hypothetical protein
MEVTLKAFLFGVASFATVKTSDPGTVFLGVAPGFAHPASLTMLFSPIVVVVLV